MQAALLAISARDAENIKIMMNRNVRFADIGIRKHNRRCIMAVYSNIDINSVCTPIFNQAADAKEFSEELLYPIVDLYRDTFVTDVLFCIFCQYSAVDSEIWTDYEDKYLQTEAEGKKVNYREQYRGIYKINQEYGVDPYAVWIRRCWELGKNPWISLRMNDCHQKDFLKSEFYYEAKKNGWMIGADYGYFSDCFDYQIDLVREKMLSYLKEQLMKYDVFGVELDFMREMYCFDYLHADMKQCVAVMNDFMRETKKITQEAEKLYHHPIRIAVRLNRDIDQAFAFGFDARTWAKEGLLDVLIPSSRWQYIDSLVPYDVWKRELKGVQILGCVETLMDNQHANVHMTDQTARGLSAGMLSQGVDGIYLFNYFGEDRVRDTKVHRTCGSLEEIYHHKVRCVLKGQEPNTCPVPFAAENPLPVILAKGQSAVLEIRTGEIPTDKKVSLILGFVSGTPENTAVFVNGAKCSVWEEYELPEQAAIEPGMKCYTAEVSNCSHFTQEIRFSAIEGKTSVRWAELVIE